MQDAVELEADLRLQSYIPAGPADELAAAAWLNQEFPVSQPFITHVVVERKDAHAARHDGGKVEVVIDAPPVGGFTGHGVAGGPGLEGVVVRVREAGRQGGYVALDVLTL